MKADIPTLLLMVIMVSLVMAGTLLALGGARRRDGLPLWAGALLLNALGHVLFMLSGRVAEVLPGVVGNALLSVALAGLTAAVQNFHGRVPRWWRLLVVPALSTVLMAVFLEYLPVRVLLANLLLVAQMAWMLRCLHRQGAGTPGRGAGVLGAGLVLMAAVLLLRSASAPLFVRPDVYRAWIDVVQMLTFTTSCIGVLVTSMGFLFMGKERADQLNHRLAAQDALTGVANRRCVLAALERDLARCQRLGEPLALVMIDLDHFKQVNDRFGHPAGDAVLCSVADTLVQRVRAQDLVGRYGGEEFLVVLPCTGRDGAWQLAQQLCAAVQAAPCLWQGAPIAVTVSVGVWAGPLEPNAHWGPLLQAADAALYRAKAAGRNRVEMAPAGGADAAPPAPPGAPVSAPAPAPVA